MRGGTIGHRHRFAAGMGHFERTREGAQRKRRPREKRQYQQAAGSW
jgi:hypothetical protein